MTTIVMTGGTSGLGAVAAARIRTTPDTRLLLGARTPGSDGAEALSLDLARLDTVRSFAARVGDRLGEQPIDALILNAGVSFRRDDQRTPDGFETTFAVNHLAHYLLLRLLLPRLSTGARVLITTSSVHDPEKDRIRPPARHADARLLAHPELDPDHDTNPAKAGGHAYTASKLCNVLTTRALAFRTEAATKKLRIIAYDPGPTPGTGLSRNFSPPIRMAWRLLGSPLGRLIPLFNSRETAGTTLAGLALGTIDQPDNPGYASLVRGRLTWPQPSLLARSVPARTALWDDSATLVGFQADQPSALP